MEVIYSYLLNFLSFILVLGIAVLIHEAGHYVVALLSGIRVEKFSIGFGKAIFSFKRGHTEYIIAPIPMGGYVKMAGDDPSEVTGADYEFYSISPWKRIPTILAGPAFNVVGAFVIFFGLAFVMGKQYQPPVVGTVIPGSIGDEAGFERNDILESVNGIAVQDWRGFETQLLALGEGGQATATVTLKRGSEPIEILLPVSDERLDRALVIGIADPTGPAFAAGLTEGDRIVSLDGYAPDTWTAFSSKAKSLFAGNPDLKQARTVTLSWATPSGEIRSASITPAVVIGATGEPTTLLGVGSAAFGLSPKIPPVVARTQRDSPARKAGLEPGATVVAVNGQIMDNQDDFQKVVTFSYQKAPEGSDEEFVGVPLEVSWKNRGESEIQTAVMTPSITMAGDINSKITLQHGIQFPIARLGIVFADQRRKIGLLGSLEEGWKETVHSFDQTLFVLKGLFTGEVNKKLLGGPVAIFQMSAQIGKEGLHQLLWFCAFLQVNLAFLNLLPIPILDGGHIVISLCEGISRRALTLRQREFVSYIGAALLIPLFLFVFYNDFDRIGLFDKIKEILF